MSSSINIWDVLIILFVHWVGDFVIQTDQQAKDKSSKMSALLSHTFTYSIMFFWVAVPLALYYTEPKWLLFMPITFIAHTITDYYTSRVNKQLYEAGKSHEFFVSIGFDQLLHFAQLLITYQLLK